MRTDLLLAQFDTLVKTPQDVAGLEAAILDLAVRGQLVAQDPNDEPATESLKRIRAERKRLIREKKIRGGKRLPPIEPDEISYDVPKGWAWVRLSEAGLINPRNEADDDIEASFVPMRLIPTEYGEAHTAEERLWGEIKSGFTHFQENDVVVAKITPCFENRKSVVMRGLRNKIGGGTTELYVFRANPEHILPDYVLVFFKTLSFIEGGRSRMTGTAGQQRVPKTYVLEVPFPLPPLAEQKRIVARVDELLAQTRALAAQLEAADEALVPAAGASFQALTSAPDQAAQHEAWQRISDAFVALTADPRTLDALKQTVLQLAVQGKLVPQDPGDEPASLLLERIRADQKRLAEEGGAAKPKQPRPIDEEETPFDLPQGWAWTRLPEVGELARGKSKQRPRNDPRLFEDGKYPFIQTGDVARSGGVIATYDTMYGDFGLAQSRMWEKGTLCITIAANIAETGILQFDACFPDSVVGFIPSSLMGSTEYFQYFIQVAKTQLEAYAPATAQKNINLRVLSDLLIPLPPANEAKRIVAKVESLLALCDTLAAEVVAAEEVRGRLLAAVLNGGH